jgi:hypothetical protein
VHGTENKEEPFVQQMCAHFHESLCSSSLFDSVGMRTSVTSLRYPIMNVSSDVPKFPGTQHIRVSSRTLECTGGNTHVVSKWFCFH